MTSEVNLQPSEGDDNLSAGVALCQLSDRLGDLLQRERRADDQNGEDLLALKEHIEAGKLTPAYFT